MAEIHNPLTHAVNFLKSVFSDPPVALTDFQKEEHRLYDLFVAGHINESEFKRRVARARIIYDSQATHIPNAGVNRNTGPKHPDGSGGSEKDN